MSCTTGAHIEVLLPLFVVIAMGAGPAAAADPPRIDCGKGFEALFCPLKVPGFIVEGRVFLAAEFMERGERIAYATLDGINFYGQLVQETADRILITEGLIVDVAEDLLPGVVLSRTVDRAVASVTGDGGNVRIRTSATEDLLKETRPRAERPAVLDYGKTVTEQSQKE